MIWTITKKEILEQFISVRFIVLTVICVTLLPMSMFVSYRDYENRITDYNRSAQLNQENLEKISFAEVFTGDFAIKGYRSPSPLSVFASGLSESMPARLEARKTGLSLLNDGAKDESILTITGKIDFVFILLIVFSLLAVLFTFDAICGEKEKGTLRAALSNSIPRDKYILGKYFGTMITPLIIAILFGLILIVLLGYPIIRNEILLRIFFIFISAVILISIFTSIGLFISSRVNNSKTSIVILISIWILLMFVIPKGSNIIAKAFIQVDSEEVVHLRKNLIRQNLELEKGKRIFEAEKILPQFDQNSDDEQENNRISEERNQVLNPIRNEFAQKINYEMNKIEDQHRLKKTWQNSLALSVARVSPATSFNKITTDFAWTGEHSRQKFTESAQAYQTVLNQALFNYIFRDINPAGGISMGIIGRINLKELPVFEFERESLADTFKAIFLDVGLLLFFTIFCFVMVYVSFLKYDIR